MNGPLRWLERGLWVLGIALAAWCAAILIESRFHQSLPLPPPATVTQQQPPQQKPAPPTAGAPRRTPPPPPGTLLARLEAPSLKLSTSVLEGSDDHTLSRGAGHIEDTPFPG